MSVQVHPTPIPVGPTAAVRSRDPSRDSPPPRFFVFFSKSSTLSSLVCSRDSDGIGGAKWAIAVQKAWESREEGSLDELDDSPVSVELAPISCESQFDRVIAEAQQLDESVVFVWMASWCRKCIYLKPKLEKLAAEYYTRLRFHCVDVNTVPHKLVTRAGVTLWKDGKKQAEVIGGHKAYLVVNEVREMIENESTV